MAVTPTRPRWPCCGLGCGAPRPPGCTSCWTCRPAGPACWPRPRGMSHSWSGPTSAWPWTLNGNYSRDIGSVDARDINSVSNWLAGLTARHHLPQKLLVLHQFRLAMIGNESSVNTRHDDLAIVIHMDGQGTPTDKQQTWQAVTGAAPRHVFFGWKNFYVKDHPMLSPRQTMARIPKPVMISYQ